MRLDLRQGNCLEVLKQLAAEGIQIDAVVTDPPYHLTSIVSRFKKTSTEDTNKTGEDAKAGRTHYARLTKGFMGQEWDGGNVAFDSETWKLVFAVMKPGAHLLAFGGTRTYHRMACAIEDAGFEIRDCVMWVYGTGFPKSHDQGNGWGTALKPAVEPIVLARKPLSESTIAGNVLKHGTGALNIDGTRIAAIGWKGTEERRKHPIKVSDRPAREAEAEGKWERRGSVESFQAEHIGDKLGRWPANVIHDGSSEVLEGFPKSNSARIGNSNNPKHGKNHKPTSMGWANDSESHDYRDSGTAARFFYSAKTSRKERGENNDHPTVKPIALMKYLATLITPPNGIILDPFMGSGSTGIAAIQGDFKFIGIELMPKYFETAKRRIAEAKEYTTFDADSEENPDNLLNFIGT